MRIKIFGRIIYVPSWIKFIFILILFIILIIIGYKISSEKDIVGENPDLSLLASHTPNITYKSETPPVPTVNYHTSPSPTTNKTITVYIVGCVANPSVVEIPVGSIVKDAVDAAGGLTADADPMKINMAYPLSDNMMIKIPSVTEKNNGISSENDNWIVTAVPVNTPSASSPATEGSNTETIININTADIKELCLLPGIGESTAQKIVNYRNEHGSFEYIEDIMKIPGIKQSRFDEIKDLITVG